MMSSDFYFRDKVPVAILGATGSVGQKFVDILSRHPWFEITALCASERNVGRPYSEAVKWSLPDPLPEHIAKMTVQACEPTVACPLIFSGLDSSVAGQLETRFAEAGYIVISNSSNHRMDADVPLVIGEVNPDHLSLMDKQPFTKGKIITNPNCSVIGLTLALKPLMDRFGLESVQVVTLQALSGAGYPGVPSIDICDNVIPYIEGEEQKIEREPLKILGVLQPEGIREAAIKISAQCNRVGVSNGHLGCVSVKFKEQAMREHCIEAWRQMIGEPQRLELPSAPFQPIHYFDHPSYPQPRLHRSLDKEMAVSIGHLRPCSILDYKFTLLSHNTMRGAVGSALLNAELLMKRGKVFW